MLSVKFCLSHLLWIAAGSILCSAHNLRLQHVVNSVTTKSFPLPFHRTLYISDPLISGNDVFILQNLLQRVRGVEAFNISGQYDTTTSDAVSTFQKDVNLPRTGIVDILTANYVLTYLTPDHYQWNFTAPALMGYKYLVHVPVHTNRSIETIGTLYNAYNGILFKFRVRAHGYSLGTNHTWPNFDNRDDGRNQFASNGNTPTGLYEMDLNSPEDIPKLYGPYPVNRAVKGLEGNAAFSVPNIRDGILLHTGEWPGWSPGEPMPNSEGCMHAAPDSIQTIWQLLVHKCGVEVHKNPGGALPYPYKSQGLLVVENIDT